jgi:ubiquitin thioesterase OTU1
VELDTSEPQKPLKSVGVESSETLTLEPADQMIQLTRGIAPVPKPFMILREIPDDNSCLFNAIGYVLENKCLYKAPQLRDSKHKTVNTTFISLVVAEYILARPLTYTTAVLGQKPSDYARWIRQSDKWGGAIELSIFSEIYGVEIASFDVQTGRMDLFGEGKGYHNRVYLQYTGIHYEAFAQSPKPDAPQSQDTALFPSADQLVLEQVRELVQVAKAAHRYTDTSGFALRCDDCQVGIKGQGEAQKHAQQTGHFNFIEYK